MKASDRGRNVKSKELFGCFDEIFISIVTVAVAKHSTVLVCCYPYSRTCELLYLLLLLLLAGTRKVKTSLDLNEARDDGVWSW